MERIVQWLDDLDDLVSLVGLLSERIRNYVAAIGFLAAAILTQAACVWLALRHPPLASAAAILLFVGLLYHTVTRPQAPRRQPA